MKKSIILLCCLSLFTCKNNPTQNDAVNSAKLIADKIIRETSFKIQVINTEKNAEITQLKLNLGETVNIRINNCGEEKKGYLALAHKGMILVKNENSVLFLGNSENAKIQEYTYNRYHFQEKLPVNWKKGENILNINNMTDSSLVLLLPVNEVDERDTDIQITNQSINLKLKEINIPENNSYKRDSYADWHYANGATMLGILNLYDNTKDKKYLDFVTEFANFTIDNTAYFEKQYFEKYAVRGSFHRLFRKTMLDDTGGPAIPFAALAADYKNSDAYSKLLSEMMDYVVNQQERLEDSTLCRPEPEPQTVWADDLFMAVPFLLRMAKITKDPSLYNEVAQQIILFNKHLKNQETGLYFHGYYHKKKENTPVQWGRANGWVAWATSEALLQMPISHPQYEMIKNIFISHLSAILSYQDSSGLWHQVLDHPETYLETSCSAMFSLAIARAIKLDFLDESYKQNAIKAWKALETKILEDGTVIDICRGTGIGNDIEFYQARKRFDHDPRGLGAVLTAACEISSL